MTDFGRVHCVVVATKGGEVVYERFYDRFSELDKAEIRAAFQQATDNVNLASDNQDFAGTFRCAWGFSGRIVAPALQHTCCACVGRIGRLSSSL